MAESGREKGEGRREKGAGRREARGERQRKMLWCLALALPFKGRVSWDGADLTSTMSNTLL